MRKVGVLACLCCVLAVGGVWAGRALTRPAQVVYVAPTNTQLASAFPGNVRSLVENGSYTLYSLDPTNPDWEAAFEQSEHPNQPVTATFYGYQILGQVAVSPSDKTVLREALYTSVARAASRAQCFHPHHGLRVTHNGKTADLVLCFSCGQMYVYTAGLDRHIAPLQMAGSSRAVFDRVLTEAGIEVKP